MNLSLNHIGIVVKDVDRYLDRRLSRTVSADIVDPIQSARIVILKHEKDHPDLELIQPLDDQATTNGFLRRNGGGYHHLCYEGDSCSDVEQYFKSERIKLIYGPVQAPALNNRQVIFGYTSNREIIEFVVGNE